MGGRKIKLKKKWQDLQSSAKKKETKRIRETKQTGGGLPPPELSELGRKVVSMIPKQLIEGIDGGMDTFSRTVSPTAAFFMNEKRDVAPKIDDMGPAGDITVTPSVSSFQQEACLKDQYKEFPSTITSGCTQSPVKVPEQERKKSFESKKRLHHGLAKTPSDTTRILKIEEEKLVLKRRKIAIMEELLIIEKEKLKVMAAQQQKSDSSPFYSYSLMSPIIKIDEV